MHAAKPANGLALDVFKAKYNAWKRYHKVSAHVLKKSTVDKYTARLCNQEYKERVAYTKKYYGGRVDNGHKMWMEQLGHKMQLVDKISLSLSDLMYMYKH